MDTHSLITFSQLYESYTACNVTKAVVDTIALREELEELNEVFTDPNIVKVTISVLYSEHNLTNGPKVFHGAESDIIWLQQDFNLYIVNLFDTFHASKVLGT